MPTQIVPKSISEIQRGDHCSRYLQCSEKSGFFEHHFIVCEVDKKNGKLKIVQIGMPNLEETINFVEGAIFKWEYSPNEEQRSPDDTICYAIENAEKENSRYNLVTNNCQHFATMCKTGKASSKQVRDAAVAGGIAAGLVTFGLGLWAYMSRSKNKSDNDEDNP